MVLKNTIVKQSYSENESAAKAIECSSLSFQGINNIHSSHGLPASVLSVGHGISDDILQEDLEHTSGLFIDETADSLNATPASEPAYGRLGNTLDVIAENLAMALCTSFSETFSSFTSSRHGDGKQALCMLSFFKLTVKVNGDEDDGSDRLR